VTADAGSPGDAAAVLAGSARSGEPDRYLAALLAPAPVRTPLLALAAFSAELANVPRLVRREPAMGEIRLQWWREALALPADERTGNPVADALRTAMSAHALPLSLLHGPIEARASDLHADLMTDDEALRTYLWKSEGALFALAGRVLLTQPLPVLDSAAAEAGHAYGLARLLLHLPGSLSRGRVPLPQARLERAGIALETLLQGRDGARVAGLLAELRTEARASLVASRQHVAQLPREVRVAFLPLALVESYLRALERQRGDPLRQEAGIAPITRITKIAAAHWLGRI
jgi:15-cis-phytoene synthase